MIVEGKICHKKLNLNVAFAFLDFVFDGIVFYDSMGELHKELYSISGLLLSFTDITMLVFLF